MVTLTHINFDIVQRSRSQCAVKIMAYDMCSRMTKHDGTGYDFRRKRSELLHAETMLPPGAPASLYDPEALANACELAEKRSDSQTGRLLLVTCPRECPEHLRIELARTIAQPYVDAGMGVAWAYHNTRGADGEEQPHFHFFLTTRAVTPEGLASKKSTEWDRRFREKIPASEDDPKPKSGTAERQRICDRANTFFARHDLQIRMDPRRLEQQGIDRPPEPDAPRQSWQQWRREGADPEAAPAPVMAVLRHRELRRELRKHEDYQIILAAQIAADTKAISLASDKYKIEKTEKGEMIMIPWDQDQQGYDPLLPDEKFLANQAFQKFKKQNPDKPEMDIKAFVMMRQAEFAKSKEENKKVERVVPKRGSKDRNESVRPEPWMSQQGGADALSKLHRESAWRSYERWIERGNGLGRGGDKLSFEGYVAFVQEQVARKGLSEGYDNAKPPSKTVRPRSADAALRERVSHVYRLLAERYAVPDELAPLVSYLDINRKNGEAVLSIKGGGHIVDTGDLLRSIDEDITADLATATVATAHARGWQSLTVTGSDDYKHAIARAAALHEPPISTDVELPRAIQHEVQAALVERAKAALAKADTANSVAPVTKTPGQPALSAAQTQAAAMLDRAQARQQAELAGEPKDQIDAKAMAEPRLSELQSQLSASRLAAEEARAAADDHAKEFPLVRRLMDQGARARHAALETEAARLEKVADKLGSSHEKNIARITAEARKEAKSAEKAHDDWRYQPAVRRAQRNIADIERLRFAVRAGDTAILEAINTGKITDAISKLPEFENSQIQKARAARTPEQIRGQAIDMAFAEADRSARDPERKEQAMEAMRAAAGGDPATIAALDSGKMDEALRAAAAWRKKLDEDAALRRKEEERKTLDNRLEPPQMAMPQP